MPTEQCVFLILYIHGILYSCVFLKLGESIYVAMDLIPILLGSLPLAHNAQHSLVLYYLLCWYPSRVERGLPRRAMGTAWAWSVAGQLAGLAHHVQ